VATLIWGYPTGGRGNNVSNLLDDFENLVDSIEDVRDDFDRQWEWHLAVVEGIDDLGISTYSKYLKFLGVQIEGFDAQILDRKIARVIEDGYFDELHLLNGLNENNAISHYPQYVARLHEIASIHPFTAEQLEMFLFIFGSNLKDD
jgi:hypothetical protein